MANSNSDLPNNRRALLRENKPYQPLRRPNDSTLRPPGTEGENSHSNEGNQTDSDASKSTLSVDAQEFYPKNYQTYLPYNDQVSTPPPQQQHHRPPLAASRYHHIMGSSGSHLRAQGPHGSFGHPHSQGNTSHHQPRSYQNWSPRNNYSRKNDVETNEGSMSTSLENGITILNSHFNTLTLDPGSFHRCMDSVASIVSNLATSNQEAINSVVSLLLDRCIEEPNFRYSGARLCHSLNQNESLQPSFRNSLLERLKLEHSEFKVNLNSNKKSRAFGFLFALAEVFSQHSNSEDEYFGDLATYLTENLELLINEPNSEHIKFACQILKLTGYQLSKKITVTNQVRIMIERLIQLPQAEPGLDRTALCLISSVRDLSACNWGHTSSPTTPPNASVGDFSAGDTAPNNHAEGDNGPVFYGPDGLVLSQEESQFLAENLSEANENDEDNFSTNGVLDDDDLDDDYDEAYEKFLEHMKNQSNRAT